MKKGSRFLVGLLAAGFTFAILTVSVGTDHWAKRGHYFHHHHHGCYDGDAPAKEKPKEQLEPSES